MVLSIDQYALTAPIAWLIAAAVLAIAEVLVPSFSFMFLSLAALVSAAVAWGDLSLGPQLGAFAVAAVASLLLLRPVAIARLRPNRHFVPSRSDVLIGKHATVIEPIAGDGNSGRYSGRILVEGLDWAAEAQEQIGAGAMVQIEEADGIVLKVRRT